MEAQKYSNIAYPKKQKNNDIIKENILTLMNCLLTINNLIHT